MNHPYPHFLIVGFMKCATTTLFEHLIAHPGVQAPIKKELHYFTRELDPFYDVTLYGMEYSEQLRFDPTSRKLCGEASPSYIIAANRISAFNPNAKIIILVRDPVERALSQFRHYRQFNLLPEGALLLDEQLIASMNVVQDSNYAPHVSSFLEHFSNRNVLLISFEWFCASQQSTTESVFHFLGLEPIPIAQSLHLSATEGHDEPAGLRHALDRHFQPRRGGVAQLIAKHRPAIYPNDPHAFARY